MKSFSTLFCAALLSLSICSSFAFAGPEASTKETKVASADTPVDVLSREDIEKIVNDRVEDILKTMPNPKRGDGNGMNIRGLPDGVDISYGSNLKIKAGGNVFKVGGRTQLDYTSWNATSDVNNQLNLENDVRFRRTRIFVSGELHENMYFKAEYDFKGGDADFTDVYVGLKGLPGNSRVQIGHQFEPFGQETVTSSKHLTLIERSLVSSLTPARNTGIQAKGLCGENRFGWAVGVYNDTDGFGDHNGNDAFNATARVNFAAIDNKEKESQVILGAAYSYRNPNGDMVSISVKPEVNSETFLTLSGINASHENNVAFEAAWMCGPASLQAEFVQRNIAVDGGSAAHFYGWHATAGYFLTGEHRRISSKSWTAGRIRPNTNFGKDGWGAFEVAARISMLDLDDNGYRGGEMTNYTAGVNWYFNPHFKAQVNVIKTNPNHIMSTRVGSATAAVVRFAVDF